MSHHAIDSCVSNAVATNAHDTRTTATGGELTEQFSTQGIKVIIEEQIQHLLQDIIGRICEAEITKQNPDANYMPIEDNTPVESREDITQVDGLGKISNAQIEPIQGIDIEDESDHLGAVDNVQRENSLNNNTPIEEESIEMMQSSGRISVETTSLQIKDNSDENGICHFNQSLQSSLSQRIKKSHKKVQPKPAASPDPEVFIIESFICRNSFSKRLLVKWKGFPFNGATWEPVKGLSTCQEVYKLFVSREKALKNLYNSLNSKPVNYYEFPTSNMRYAVTDMCYHLERYINKKIEESSLINKAPVYIVNWNDYDSVPDIAYCTTSTVGAKMISDLELDKIIEPCKNCVATKATDNCQSMEQYFKQSDIAYQIKPVKMECSAACNCLIKPCPTTIVNQGRKIPVIIYKTPNKGWGLYAGRVIEKNEFICEYIGEIIGEADATSRNGNYIFSMDYMSGDDESTKFHIDARKFCSEARFVNHSCNSNSEIHAVYSLYKNLDYHKVAFFAKRKIVMGEEITINYFNGVLPQGEKIEYDDCFCGARSCIKKIPKGKNDGKKL